MGPQNIFLFPHFKSISKKEMECRFESLCHRKDLVQQNLRGQTRFLQSFVTKSPFSTRKLMVVFAVNEGLTKSMNADTRGSAVRTLVVTSIGCFYQNNHCRLRIRLRLERKATEKGFYSWKEEGNSPTVAHIFLQVPEANNR